MDRSAMVLPSTVTNNGTGSDQPVPDPPDQQ